MLGSRVKLVRLLTILAIIFFLLFSWSSLLNSPEPEHDIGVPNQTDHGQQTPEFTIKGQNNLRNYEWPYEYGQPSTQTLFCEERFGVKYLENFSNLSTEYCQSTSQSQLRCFSSITDVKSHRKDMFCIGGPAHWRDGRFFLECSPKTLSDEDREKGLGELNELSHYWYGTGPGAVFRRLVELRDHLEVDPVWPTEQLPFTILVKREDVYWNTWHALMEIFATLMTLDILRLTINPATQAPYIQSSDFSNTQVLLIDDKDIGPYYQLWNLFAEKPILRLNEMNNQDQIEVGNIILPIAGGANPFWQGDWTDLECTNSSLLQAFSRRVLNFFDIDQGERELPFVLTFIDRKEKRLLIDQIKYIQALKTRHPVLEINVVDFASISFSEQLNIVRGSDILVGVHGAGLTHGMFLPPKSAMIEIMPFNLDHRGFGNMAQMLGLYHIKVVSQEKKEMTDAHGDWQSDNVYIDQDAFIAAVDDAINHVVEARGPIVLDLDHLD